MIESPNEKCRKNAEAKWNEQLTQVAASLKVFYICIYYIFFFIPCTAPFLLLRCWPDRLIFPPILRAMSR